MNKSVPNECPQMITVEIAPIQVNRENEKDVTSEHNVWSLYLPQQFPVLSIDQFKRKVVLNIGPPHQGYKIYTSMVNNKLEGKAKLLNTRNKIIATFSYVKGEMTGLCKIYFQSGELYYRGYLLNGYRHGYGEVYDKQGERIFEGFYKSGMRINNIKRMENMKDYWQEEDMNGNILSVCQKDAFGNNQNLCYFFNQGVLDRVCYCENNIVTETILRFENNKMWIYKKGVARYYGTYCGSIYTGFEKRCGTEFDKTGKNVTYCGDFINGRRNGFGASYKKNKSIKYEGNWIYGYHEMTFRVIFIAIPTIVVVFLMISTYYIPLAKYKMIASMFLLLFSVLLYYFIRKQWLLCPLTIDFEPKATERPFEYSDVCTISENRFHSTGNFSVNGLQNLVQLDIGRNSFLNIYNLISFMHNPTSYNRYSFNIDNCESLQSITIGENSFCEYAGIFKLTNLQSLHTIRIGSIGLLSYNFYNCSFVLQGMDVVLSNESKTYPISKK